jgi:hypothetical protein
MRGYHSGIYRACPMTSFSRHLCAPGLGSSLARRPEMAELMSRLPGASKPLHKSVSLLPAAKRSTACWRQTLDAPAVHGVREVGKSSLASRDPHTTSRLLAPGYGRRDKVMLIPSIRAEETDAAWSDALVARYGMLGPVLLTGMETLPA